MINTGPSNDKIYQRCVTLIGEQVIKKSWGKRLTQLDHVLVSPAVAGKLPRIRSTQLQCELDAHGDGPKIVSVCALIAAISELCLMKSIYNSDFIDDKLCKANVSDHIKQYLSQVDSPCSTQLHQIDHSNSADDSVSAVTVSGNRITAILPVAFLVAVSAYEIFYEGGEVMKTSSEAVANETSTDATPSLNSPVSGEITTSSNNCKSDHGYEEERNVSEIIFSQEWNSAEKSKWTIQSAKNVLMREPRISQLLKNILSP